MAERLIVFQRLKGTIILEVSHGYDVKGDNNRLVDLAEKCMDEFSMATSMGFFVDLFPACQRRDLDSWNVLQLIPI